MLDPDLHDPRADIAIVGLACRFPGAPDPERYARLVLEGGTGLRDLTPAELRADGVPAAVRGDPAYVARGGPLEHIDLFDAGFFALTPREAERMDPQHRLALELAVEALEDAGLPFGAGQAVGVFAGCSNPNYLLFNVAQADARWFGTPDYVESMIATDRDYLATRISYRLHLTGPSLTVQTACSSALVAVHLACQSLLLGECDAALAGGVSVQVPHRFGYRWQEGGYGSRDGVCRPYSAEGGGTVFTSGGGLVALRRLSDAVAEGDAILAVVKGTGVANDGAARSGFTAPGVDGQARTIAAALAAAGVAPARIGLVEGHGTGTPLGDPIEVAALTRAYAEAGGARNVALGSVKGNIGHLDTAAGIAGLIKLALARDAGVLPPSLHAERTNPRIAFAETPFYVNTRSRPWPKDKPFAGLSSFGIGGTNAHAIVGPAPHAASPAAKAADGPALLVLSARSPEALEAAAERTAAWLRGPGRDLPFPAIAACAARRRARHPERLALAAPDADAAAQALEARRTGAATPIRARRGRAAPDAPSPVWIFPGQGGQAPGMGRGLVDLPGVAETLARIEAVSGPVAGRSLVALLTEEEAADALARPGPVVMACFALQAGLAAAWRALGLAPAAVAGWSLGEIAAAHVAGALDLEQATRIAVARAAAFEAHPSPGLMAQLSVDAGEAEALLAACAPDDVAAGRIWLAAETAPGACLVAGAHAAVRGLCETLAARGETHASRGETLAARGIEARIVPTGGVAGHGPSMEPAAAALEAALADLAPAPPRIPFHGAVEGRAGETRLDAGYWAQNMRRPVRLAPVLAGLVSAGHARFLDIAPRPASAGPLDAAARAAGAGVTVLPSAERDAGRLAFLDSLARLHVAGFEPDWRALHPGPVPALRLPAYPWQRARHWVERAPAAPIVAAPADGASGRDAAIARLLGRRLTSSLGDGTVYREGVFDPQADPILADHRVGGLVVLPGATICDMVLAAASELPEPIAGLADVVFEDAIVASPAAGVALQLALTPAPEGYSFRLARGGAPGDPSPVWRRAASGRVRVGRRTAPPAPPPPPLDLEDVVEADDLYPALARSGVAYGPAFRLIERVAVHGAGLEAQARASAEADARAGAPPGPAHAFPLLDAALQTLAADPAERTARMPTHIARLDLHAGAEAPPPLLAIAASRAREAPGRAAILRADGAPLLVLDGIEAAAVAGDAHDDGAWLHVPAWRALEAAAAPAVPEGVFALLGGPDALADALAARLAQAGARPVRIATPDDPADATAWRAALAPLGAEPAHCLDLAGPETDGASPGDAAAEACAALLARSALLRALAAHRAPVRLSAILPGATEASPVLAGPAPVAAALWGFYRTLAVEHPEIAPRCVDVDAQADAEAILAAVLRAEEPELAIRAGRLLAPRLEPAGRAPAAPARLRADGTWLVAGGTGALAPAVLRALAARGVRDVVVAARTPPRVPLAVAGARVAFHRLDLEDPASVHAAIAEIVRAHGPLRGVVHMAGRVRDGFADRLAAADVAAALAPKIAGALALDAATRGCDLDGFVLFSSAAALVGAPGQGAHAAANEALARLAAHRAARGLPARVVDWGPWADALPDPAQEAAHRAMGMDPIEAARGARLLAAPLDPGPTRLAVFRFDPARWRARFPSLALPPLLAAPAPAPAEAVAAPGLAGLDPAARARRVAEVVRAELGAILGRAPDTLDADAPFAEENLSSMMALELRSRLEAALGLVIPTTAIWRHPTLARLADALAGDAA
ncbi:SDR family NAD(P)-dependent oxidoreductase [Salinarimonas sp.]|uniref:type I polyketide synthase n=1 Tax=Salinarimonas sp. TaxID=2766526 RepID=UPI0032D93F83